MFVHTAPRSHARWRDILGAKDFDVIHVTPAKLSGHQAELADVDLILMHASNTAPDDILMCERLYAAFDRPILMIADNETNDFALKAYAAGASECISAAHSDALILAKIHAWLRWRARRPDVMAETSEFPVGRLIP
jgi:DNA-binding response OmpR family regulator